MSIVVPSGNKCLEPGPLACTCLLLHGHNLQNLVLEGCPQEKVNDLRFLNRQRKEIDFFQGLDFHVLDQAAQLGDGDLLLILGLASASSTASTRPWPRPWPWMPLPNPPRKPQQPPIPGLPGPLGPPTASASPAIWCFLGKKEEVLRFQT